MRVDKHIRYKQLLSQYSIFFSCSTSRLRRTLGRCTTLLKLASLAKNLMRGRLVASPGDKVLHVFQS